MFSLIPMPQSHNTCSKSQQQHQASTQINSRNERNSSYNNHITYPVVKTVKQGHLGVWVLPTPLDVLVLLEALRIKSMFVFFNEQNPTIRATEEEERRLKLLSKVLASRPPRETCILCLLLGSQLLGSQPISETCTVDRVPSLLRNPTA